MKPFVTAADAKHREEFKEFVISHADNVYRPVLRRLYAFWETYAKELFDKPIVPPYIMLAAPSRAQALGDYSPVSGFGGHSQIRIRPTLLSGHHKIMKSGERYAEGRMLFVADVLLHEMIHQYHQEITGHTEDSYKGHGTHFRDTCNEFGKVFGLSPVRVAKARGSDKALPSCAQWPHCVRPKNYYKGAYIQGADKKGAEDFDKDIKAKRGALKKRMEDARSESVVTLIEAAQNFARFWPDGTEKDALTALPTLGQEERRQIAAFLRAAQHINIGI